MYFNIIGNGFDRHLYSIGVPTENIEAKRLSEF